MTHLSLLADVYGSAPYVYNGRIDDIADDQSILAVPLGAANCRLATTYET